MKRVIILQARTGSRRLPGKVLKNLKGRPMLVQQLNRLKRCQLVDEIVVATTATPADDSIVDVARREDVRWFRGSEQDVLSRYVGAAAVSQAEIVVRVTADCPLIDPEQTDKVILELESHAGDCDYASNVIKRTFPQGLDTEAFFCDVLERIDRLARSAESREHVTYFLRLERPDLFSVRSVTDREDNSDLRWTVDTPKDFEMVQQIYEKLALSENHVTYQEILGWVRAHPALSNINTDATQRVI
jgi:spore coat polysaccharide biosynthesis protein SpsF